jgi:hypothetical protein
MAVRDWSNEYRETTNGGRSLHWHSSSPYIRWTLQVFVGVIAPRSAAVAAFDYTALPASTNVCASHCPTIEALRA